MRIGIAAPAVPPVVGGVESFLGFLVSELAREHEVHLITGNRPDPELIEAVTGSGGSVTLPPNQSPEGALSWEFHTFSRARAISDVVLRSGLDVIHAASHDAALAAAVAASVTPSLTIVAAFGEMATQASDFGRGRTRFVYALPQVNRFVAWSQYYAGLARMNNCPADKLAVVFAGVDAERFAGGDPGRGRALLGCHPGEFVVLCPSRFTPRKGQTDLVTAIPALARSIPRLRVVLTGSVNSGSVSYLDDVRALIRRTGVDELTSIRLEVPYEHMPHAYAAADVVVQPSHSEGLGLSALEAMASRTCTLVSAVDGFLELGMPPEGMFEPRDPDSLATAVIAVANDPPARDRLGSAGQSIARQRFDARRTVRELAGIYQAAIAERGR